MLVPYTVVPYNKAFTVEKVLNKHAALKKKSVRANDSPFMTKT